MGLRCRENTDARVLQAWGCVVWKKSGEERMRKKRVLSKARPGQPASPAALYDNKLHRQAGKTLSISRALTARIPAIVSEPAKLQDRSLVSSLLFSLVRVITNQKRSFAPLAGPAAGNSEKPNLPIPDEGGVCVWRGLWAAVV